MTLDEILALLPDNTTGAIDAADLRTAVTELWNKPAGTTPAGASRLVPVFIFQGESNSGGYALNTDATAAELAPRPCVQIFDNIGLQSFSALDIGTNNLLDHSGLPPTDTHGWELELANQVEAGQWWDSTVYLIKTGQGGSRVDEWGVGSVFWTKFLERTRNGLALLRAMGKVPIVYFWVSHLGNDAIQGTPEATAFANIKELHTRMVDEVGYAPIIMTKFMDSCAGSAWNDAIDQYGVDDHLVLPVEPSQDTRDANHWNYVGMKFMADQMKAASQAWGQHENYLTRQTSILAGGNAVGAPPDVTPPPTGPTNTVPPAVTGTTGVGDTLTCTPGTWNPTPTGVTYQWKRGGVDISGATANTHVIVSADQNTALTCAVTATDANGSTTAVSNGTTIPGPPSTLVPYSWTDLTAVTEDGNHDVTATGSVPAGANAVGGTLDATQPFRLVSEWYSTNDAAAALVFLDDVASTDFTWGAGQTFVSGVYQFGGTAYWTVDGANPTPIAGWTVTFPCKVKVENSGNDLIYSSSPDGVAWTPRYTHVGVLAGKTTLHVRLLFAQGNAGQKMHTSHDSDLQMIL